MTTTNASDTQKLLDMIKDLRFTMMTTVTADGPRARPMTTLETEADGSLWFFCSSESSMVDEIATEPRIGLAYANDGSADYVSITGRARVLADAAKAKDLWNPALKAWFTEGLDDPTLRLIEVTIESGGYWDAPDNRFVRLAGILAAAATGKEYDAGETGHVQVR